MDWTLKLFLPWIPFGKDIKWKMVWSSSTVGNTLPACNLIRLIVLWNCLSSDPPAPWDLWWQPSLTDWHLKLLFPKSIPKAPGPNFCSVLTGVSLLSPSGLDLLCNPRFLSALHPPQPCTQLIYHRKSSGEQLSCIAIRMEKVSLTEEQQNLSGLLRLGSCEWDIKTNWSGTEGNSVNSVIASRSTGGMGLYSSQVREDLLYPTQLLPQTPWPLAGVCSVPLSDAWSSLL